MVCSDVAGSLVVHCFQIILIEIRIDQRGHRLISSLTCRHRDKESSTKLTVLRVSFYTVCLQFIKDGRDNVEIQNKIFIRLSNTLLYTFMSSCLYIYHFSQIRLSRLFFHKTRTLDSKLYVRF